MDTLRKPMDKHVITAIVGGLFLLVASFVVARDCISSWRLTAHVPLHLRIRSAYIALGLLWMGICASAEAFGYRWINIRFAVAYVAIGLLVFGVWQSLEEGPEHDHKNHCGH